MERAVVSVSGGILVVGREFRRGRTGEKEKSVKKTGSMAQSDFLEWDGFSEHIRYSRKRRMALREYLHRLEKQRDGTWLDFLICLEQTATRRIINANEHEEKHGLGTFLKSLSAGFSLLYAT